MGTRTISRQRPGGAEMGQVFIDFSVENSAGRTPRHADGQRPREQLGGIVMDTGATHLCLPADIIARLGLELDREVAVKVATGIEKRRIFTNVRVVYEDRRTVTDCIELPAGMPALLGAIPMEGLGIEPDLQNRTVRKLPMGLDGSYITA